MSFRSTLDALLGIISDDGEELELSSGLNFIGFTITYDAANDRYDISSPIGSLDSDDIDNASGVSGSTVTAALDALNTAIGLRALAATNMIAGAGLTGGGTLGADRTFTVAAADATITVNADSIQVGTLVAGNYVNNTIALARLVNATAARVIGATGAGAWGELTGTQVAALLAGPVSGLTTLAIGGAFTGATSIACTSLSCVGPITNVTLINGAAPLAPVEGTVLADAAANIVPTDGSQIRIPTLTANRVYDINNTGAIDEETVTLYRTGTEAFTATIRDAADATIATFPASAKLAGVFRKATGANFVFVGFYRLA